MKTLKQQTSTLSEGTVGVISALIIVPQQTTGRLFLNFGNEIFRDFDLPHKALCAYYFNRLHLLECLIYPSSVLPGGGSDVNTEAEEMSKQRIDILISVSAAISLNLFMLKLFIQVTEGIRQPCQQQPKSQCSPCQTATCHFCRCSRAHQE